MDSGHLNSNQFNLLPQSEKDELLLEASKHDCTALVKELIQAGANLESRTQEGHTALMCAALKNYHTTAFQLLKAMSDEQITAAIKTNPMLDKTVQALNQDRLNNLNKKTKLSANLFRPS